ncbi:hypothetical protein GJ496_002880 [Pomphorhynchus laevis]|nr:hypothetical protein GJ496_002880 [Pomphorhynchus laevis]
MFVRVVDSENESGEVIEIPIEDDGCILLSTICSHYPNASGLKYLSKESGVWRAVRVVDQKLYPSEGSWADVENYNIVYPKGILDTVNSSQSTLAADAKRKVDDDGISDSDSKLRRVDSKVKSALDDNDKPLCTDLIVLGVNFKSKEETLREYFSQFGELELCEIKRDYTGNSKGFGFIRFKDYSSQLKVLKEPQHYIDGRPCQAKIPESKYGSAARNPNSMRKVFVARLPQGTTSDDLRNYFSKFGDIVDIYMSQPFRSFGFVTFRDPECVPCLFAQSHTINGTNVHIGPAEPKGSNDMKQYHKLSMHFDEWSPTHRGSSGGSMRMGSHSSSFPSGYSSGDRSSQRYNRGDSSRRFDDYDDYDGGYHRISGGGSGNISRSPYSVGNRGPTSRFSSSGGIDNYSRKSQSPRLPQDHHAINNSQSTNIDLTSMASMLTPAMMATFLNMAAAAQQNQMSTNSSADSMLPSPSPGNQSSQIWSDLKSWQKLADACGSNNSGGSGGGTDNNDIHRGISSYHHHHSSGGHSGYNSSGGSQHRGHSGYSSKYK